MVTPINLGDIFRRMVKCDSENKLGLRERKHVKLREAITRVSVDLFLNNGFEQTTIGDIVDKIDISKQTFFRYFDSKESVVITSYHKLFNVDANPTSVSLISDPIIILHSAYRKFAEQYDSNKIYYIEIEKFISGHPSIRAKKTDLLYQEARKHCYDVFNFDKNDRRKWLDHQFIINLSICTFMTAVDTWVYSDGALKLSKLIDKGFNLIKKERNKIFA